MHKFILSLFVLASVVPALVGMTLATPAHAASAGLIKGPGDTVYWYSINGKRYVFPTFGTYWSWYGYTQQAIQQVSLTELGSITIGGNVTYKPGVRMLKITTDPKVYAVGRYGELRWVTSESIAVQLYGSDWAHMIHDVPDEFFVNYTIGSPITSASDFNPTAQTAAVSSPEDNIGRPPVTTSPPATDQGNATTFTTSLSPDQTSVMGSDTVTYTASVKDLDGLSKFEIYINNNKVNECVVQGLTEKQGCGISFIASQYDDEHGQVSLSARAVDAFGNVTWSTLRVIGVQTESVSTPAVPAAPSITSPYSDQIFTNYPRTMTVAWANDNQPKHNVEITCDYCVSSSVPWSGPNTYVTSNYATSYAPSALAGDNQFRVRVQAVNANGVAGAWSGYTYFKFKTTAATPAAPIAPTITSPTANQIFTNYPRTMTVTWVNDNQPKHNVEITCDYCVSASTPWSGPSTYSVSNSASSYSPSALAGDNQFRVRVQAVNINGVTSPWSDYVYFKFKTATAPLVLVLAAPTITSPSADQIFTNYPRTMTVTWANDNQPKHNVEITCDYCVSSSAPWSGPNTYVTSNYATSYAPSALAGDNQFRVRVQAVSSDGTVGTWSNYVYFKFKTTAAAPVAPTITAPYSDQIFTNYPRTMTVTWANDNQPKHNVEITCDYCVSASTPWSGPNTYSVSNSASSYSPSALAGDNQFRVRVQAVNANGVAGAWSGYTYFKFKTTAPAPIAPTITSPTNDQILTNYPRTMTVTWVNDNQPKHNVEITCDYCVSSSVPWSGPNTYVTSNSASSYSSSALPGDNQFRVRVQSVNVNGVAGAWSGYTYFRFKTTVNTTPTPYITPVQL